VDGHQIGVDVDRAADVVREDVAERVIESILDLGLEHFPGQFVRHCDEKGGTDEALGLREDDKAALPGRNAVVLFEKGHHAPPGTSDSVGVVGFVYCHQIWFLKACCLHYMQPQARNQGAGPA
jgi:hypothetical protein